METIVDVAQWVLWIACAVILVTWLAELVLKTYVLIKIKQHQSELQPVLDYAEQAAAGNLILLTVEVDQNQYLCYNAVTQEFVCQGVDITEISQRFSARFPDKTVAIFNGDTTAVATLKQQFRTRHENLNLQ
jgi:hypothetical protein